MKQKLALVFSVFLIFSLFSGCHKPNTNISPEKPEDFEGTQIQLSDNGITVNSAAVTGDREQAVYIANDIIYYEAGHDFTYGEGSEKDAHSAAEAAAHTVVHITKPGQYILSGKLSKGQIAIDLGENAEEDPSAVVTLVLCGVNITCEVAPAILFYNVYECGNKDETSAGANVDTSKAGANILLADATENTISGSYVAKIYKPGTVELNEDGTEVLDAKKLHKYDGAVYSKMSMNVDGSGYGIGSMKIHAENEGLDSELHLTINGGQISINSGNDGINTNEDNISVTTINGGSLDIIVNGSTGEGDGIDSNGWLVINNGMVKAQACATSGDAGIDSDMGIHINGGFVFATGNMLDRIAESKQNYAVFQLAQANTGAYELKNSKGDSIAYSNVENRFTYLLISTGRMAAGDYTLWCGDTQLQGMASGNMGGPSGMQPPADGQQPPEGIPPHDGIGGQPGSRPGQGNRPGQGGQSPENGGTPSTTFPIQDGGNYFVSVKESE